MRLKVAHPSEGKAPATDGRLVKLYRHLPSLQPYLLGLLYGIYRTGVVPYNLRLIQVVPIAKPGNDARDANKKRPISHIHATMKILEGII